VLINWWFERNWRGAGSNCSPYKLAALRASRRWTALGRRLEFVDHGCTKKHYPESYSDVTYTDPYGWGNYCDLKTGAARTPVSIIFWEDISQLNTAKQEALGATITCSGRGGRPSKFIMAINPNPISGSWYAGADPRVPANRNDLESTMMHEFGHATGWGPHYDDHKGLTQGGAVCTSNRSDRETMCSSSPLGESWERGLGPHDRETFFKAYGPR
jgi:hypothetical protein